MATLLLESGARRHRSFNAAIPSIALHSALVLAAIHATAHAALRPTAIERAPMVLLPAPARDPAIERKPPVARTVRSANAIQSAPQYFSNPNLSALPTLTVPGGDWQAHGPIVSPQEFSDGRMGPAVGVPSRNPGAVVSSDRVDRQAEALPGTVVPRYPETLRGTGVQGIVVAQFVVDTAGRVEPGSFRAVGAVDERFVTAVLRAVAAARFRPAEVNGVPVRELVQQSFSFVIR